MGHCFYRQFSKIAAPELHPVGGHRANDMPS